MGTPRHPRTPSSTATTSKRNSKHASDQSTSTQTPPVVPTPPPPPNPSLRMSAASRYTHNLKVLRRRDPTIISVFDQFSHVCVYHHNGSKWEKQGFEGSMFLYERSSYPPYGFYILNRMGVDDYIQRLYPEDDIGAGGSYVMLRSYPEFTARRLAAAQKNGPLDKFAPEYALQNAGSLADRGHPQTVGLWMFATDAREPLIDAMMRLHSYIKRNLPYPDEYRYGPDHPPPPPNVHSRNGSGSSSNLRPESQISNTTRSSTTYPNESSSNIYHSDRTSHMRTSSSSSDSTSASYLASSSRTPSQAHTTSSLDALFAKLAPSPAPSASASKTQNLNSAPISTSSMSVQSLLAVLGVPEISSAPAPSWTPVHTGASLVSPQSTQSPTANKGLALLDSIFASATPPPALTRDPEVPPARPDYVRPSSPATLKCINKPPSYPPWSQPGALVRMQELYAESKSRGDAQKNVHILTQEVLTTLLGLPHPSIAKSAEGSFSSISPSSSPRTRTPSAASSREGDNEAGEWGDDQDDGSDSVGLEYEEFSSEPKDTEPQGSSTQWQVNGDVTPRPSTQLSPLTSTIAGPQATSFQSLSSLDASLVRSPKPSVSSAFRSHDLFRDPTVPLDEVECDVVELDFTDTSALSDMDTFRRKVDEMRGTTNSDVVANGAINGHVAAAAQVGVDQEAAMDVKKVRKKTHEEQVLLSASFSGAGSITTVTPLGGRTTPSTALDTLFKIDSTITPLPAVNGTNGSHQLNLLSNGKVKSGTDTSNIDAPLLRNALLSAMPISSAPRQHMERNEFVRELLTLVHTDKAFVDQLWSAYLAQTQTQ